MKDAGFLFAANPRHVDGSGPDAVLEPCLRADRDDAAVVVGVGPPAGYRAATDPVASALPLPSDRVHTRLGSETSFRAGGRVAT